MDHKIKRLEKKIKELEEKMKIKKIAPATMRVEEAAEYLGISVCLLREQYGANKIPCIRPNGKHGIVLFRKQSLDMWMDNHEKMSLDSLEVIPNYNKVQMIR